MKTNKSFSKRIRVTSQGKLLARFGGKNHFNAKKSGQTQLADKRSKLIELSPKNRSRFLANQ
ncbi:MAG: 50S ribosomal protein L35 [Candidatus Vogelbacteria bacterium]|nr:50S ribosomal protein L35 [Candidatus Vogelbacteria bacterium]